MVDEAVSATDLPVLVPAKSTCLYCACGMHDHCVLVQRDEHGRVDLVCACGEGEHR